MIKNNFKSAFEHTRKHFPFKGYMSNIEKYESQVDTVVKYLKPGGKILDFGCGPMDFNGILQSMGYLCTGYDDLSDEWHKIESNKIKIYNYVDKLGMKLDKATEKGFLYPDEEFDMFMTHDVMEHIHDSPKDMLIDGLRKVKPGGYLYITVPSAVNIKKRFNLLRGITNYPSFEQYYWHPKPWRGHIREYSRNDLKKLTELLELELVELTTVHHMLDSLSGLTLRLYKFISAFMPNGKDTWKLVAKKPSGWSPKVALNKEEFSKLMGTTAVIDIKELYDK